MRIMLNHLNLAILKEIAQTATKIADRGTARGDFLMESNEYVDADTLTMVLHDIREKLGDMDEHQRNQEG